MKKSDGTRIEGNKEIAEALNSYFCSVYNKIDQADPPDIPMKKFHAKLDSAAFTLKEVSEKLSGLKISGAPRPDGISNGVLKTLNNELSPALTIIFNKSMASGAVPDDWRTANVTPIYKKGTKSDPGNYRPVSLTSVVCKTMESLIADRIITHIDMNSLLHNSQHGFRKNKSCCTNLLEFMEVVTSIVDKGHPVDIAYLDFSKAFDKVPWKRLLKKVKSFGVDGDILAWITAWLSNRKQRVVINGSHSEWEQVTSGVPQGSVIGPLLFLLYIDDIDDEGANISVIRKFADDTKLGQIIKSDADRAALQGSLEKMEKWAEKWGMSFNVAKCKILHIGRTNPKYDYIISGTKLTCIESECDIGVTISSNLKPSQHCVNAARKGHNALGQIWRAFHYRDKNVYLRLYKQQVRPLLEFATPVWSPWSAIDIDILENVQRRFVRSVSGLSGQTYEDKLTELDILSLSDRRLQHDLVQAFKIIHGLDNVDRSSWFTLMGDSDNNITRQQSNPLNIRGKRATLDVYKNFFSNRVVDHWNSLPDTLKMKGPLSNFRKKLIEHLKIKPQ